MWEGEQKGQLRVRGNESRYVSGNVSAKVSVKFSGKVSGKVSRNIG